MRSHDPTFPLFPTLSFLGFILALIPLPWHIHAWNSGTCSFMIWTAVACLNLFVNSLIWKGNVLNVAPVWCDISSKLYIGVSIAIPASILCISRRLYSLLTLRTSSITREDKRRMVIVDMFISLGIPIVGMALHYVIQGHRFDIMEDIGCFPSVYEVTLAYPLYLLWPPLLGLASGVYSVLTLIAFWKRRAQFAQVISSNSGMTVGRYMRLMALSGADILFNIPLGILVIYLGAQGQGPAPWISWEDTHYNFSRVGLFPAILWRADPSVAAPIELTRWLPVFCSFIFFALFGFAAEARKNYHSAFWAVAKVIGLERHMPAAQPKTVLPSWVKHISSRGNSAGVSIQLTKQEKTSTSKTSSFLTDSSHIVVNDEVYAFSLNKCLPPLPPYSRYTPQPIPLNIPMSRECQVDVPGSPTPSITTTVTGSTTINCKKLEHKSSSSSLSSIDPALYEPRPMTEAAPSPLLYQPFSPLSYPATEPHQLLNEHLDGIHVTIQPRISRSFEPVRR